MMKLNFFINLIIILSTISLFKCKAKNIRSENYYELMEKPERKPGEPLILRQKRVVKFEDLPSNVKKRLVDNLNSIKDYEDNNIDDSETNNYVEEKNILKRDIDFDENDELLDEERTKRDEKKMKNLELAKSELGKIQKNLENEILNLVKRSKKYKDDYILTNNNLKRQVNNPIDITAESQPRLLKIKVETVEFDQNTNDNNNNNENNNNSKNNKLINKNDNVGRRQTNNLNNNDKEIENKIKKRIEMIRELVKRELEEKNKIKQIEINNAKFDELQESIENNYNNEIIEKKNINNDKNINTRNKRKIKNKKIIKKSILIPERAQAKIEDKLSPDLEVDPRLSFSEANKYYRSSRDVGDNHGSNDVNNDQQIKINQGESKNFLFPGQLNNRQRRGMLSNHKNNKLSKNHKRHDKQKRQQKNQRPERAADEILNNDSSDSVAESDGNVDISNSQDISPQLVPEYKEAFGGLPSDINSDFFRYKRIKRDKY